MTRIGLYWSLFSIITVILICSMLLSGCDAVQDGSQQPAPAAEFTAAVAPAEPHPRQQQVPQPDTTPEPEDESADQSAESEQPTAAEQSAGDDIDESASSTADGDETDFTPLSLEVLMDMDFTLVSGVAKPVMSTPAATYVITAEDIRRGGHRSLREILRTAPGMHVAQISANEWAVTSRGFNGLYANKLLVLIDGRSVYTPSFVI